MPANNRKMSYTNVIYIRFTDKEKERARAHMESENMPSLSALIRKVVFDHFDKKEAIKK